MHTIPEIRYDHMTDRALLDPESTAALFAQSALWAERSCLAADDFRPLRRSVQTAWEAMARLRAREAFKLTVADAYGFDLTRRTAAPIPLTRRVRPAFGTWSPLTSADWRACETAVAAGKRVRDMRRDAFSRPTDWYVNGIAIGPNLSR